MKKLLLLCLATLTLAGCNVGNHPSNSNYIGGGACLATSLQWSNNTLFSSCLPMSNYWNQNNFNTLLSSSSQATNNWGISVQDQTGNILGYTVDRANGNYYTYSIKNSNGNLANPTWVYNSSGIQIGNDNIDGGSVEDILDGQYVNAITAFNNYLYFGGVDSGTIWTTNNSNSASIWTNTLPNSNWTYDGISSLTVDPISSTLYVLGNCGLLHYYSNGMWQTYTDTTIQNNLSIGIGGNACSAPLDDSAFVTSLSTANGNLYILISSKNANQSYLYSMQESNISAVITPITSTQSGFSNNTYTAMTTDDNNHLWAAQIVDSNYDMQAVQIY